MKRPGLDVTMHAAEIVICCPLWPAREDLPEAAWPRMFDPVMEVGERIEAPK